MLLITYILRLLRTTKVERISNVFRLLYNYEEMFPLRGKIKIPVSGGLATHLLLN
jgi:hypothetical protein